MRRISRFFMSLLPEALVNFGRGVETKMSQETGIFSNPTPPISTLSATREALEVAIDHAKDGGLVQRQDRDALEVVYKQQLLQLADYVALQVSNDPALMERSGYTLTKVREEIGPMPAVSNLSVTYPAFSGEMDLKWSRIYGAQSYTVQHKEYGTADWATTNSTRGKTTISFLEPQKKYVFRVAAIGSKGQGPWSQDFVAIAI